MKWILLVGLLLGNKFEVTETKVFKKEEACAQAMLNQPLRKDGKEYSMACIIGLDNNDKR